MADCRRPAAKVPWSGHGTLAATPSAGLKVPSVVRFDKLATLDRIVIAGKLGDAPPDWLAAKSAAFFSVFGFPRG